MQPFLPDFELIKMDAEIGSYQEDQDPDRDGSDAPPLTRPTDTTPSDPGT
jgi:hypothetical protein